jgi:hypothetical protein
LFFQLPVRQEMRVPLARCRKCALHRLLGITAVGLRGSVSFGQKTHLTAFSSGLLMIITQEPAQSLAALDAPLSIEVTVPRK